MLIVLTLATDFTGLTFKVLHSSYHITLLHFRNIFLTLVASAIVAPVVSVAGILTSTQTPFIQQATRAQIAFTENKGQVHDQNYHKRPDVLYSVQSGELGVHIKKGGISYQLVNSIHSNKKGLHNNPTGNPQEILYRVDIDWLQHNSNFTVSTDGQLPGVNNYYLENCAEGVLNLKSYTGITLHHLYQGINLHYYETNGLLKHDYIVAPHADYKQIQLELKGANVSLDKNGALYIETPLGTVVEEAPLVYQKGKQIAARWKIKTSSANTNTACIIGFEIEKYNPNEELIIDPVTRLWGTYYGGNGSEEGWFCTTDAGGNVFLTGRSDSNTGTMIATIGAHQTFLAGGMHDAFLVKFNSNGIRQWGTYYGGANTDFGMSCSADPSGNIFLSGYTSSGSSTVISTAGSHQSTYGGGIYDVFLVKFNSAGIRQWGSYYGGSGGEFGGVCTTDATGNVYLAGYTNSGTGTAIATAGAHQSVFGGGSNNDAFLVKFNSNGVRQWGTYYGGSGTDIGNACSTDPLGNVYLAGRTLSTGSVMATAAAHQVNHSGGTNNDAFVVKFNTSGIRQWGTYYGGAGGDAANACVADASGNVYLTGYTETNTGTAIATAGAHQSTYGGGLNDAFIVKFDITGARQWGTYYGGGGTDVGNHCSLDASGNLYVGGATESSGGTEIASPSAYQSAYGGGSDAFLVMFNGAGTRLWGTYYGGSGLDYGTSCRADGNGNIYLAGYTETLTGTVIATAGAHQNSYGGGLLDAFIVKLTECAPFTATAAATNSLCAGATLSFSSGVNTTFTPAYNWTGPNGFSSNLQNPVLTNASLLNAGIYTVAANSNGCIQTATVNVSSIYPNPTITVNNGTVCIGQSFTIAPGGASTYTIQGGNYVVSPTVNTNYTVTGTSTAGCLSSNTATCFITVSPLPTVSVNSGTICSGNSFTISPSGANTYTIQGGNSVVSPTANANYTITGTNMAGCLSANTATASITVNTTPTVTVNSGTICSGQTFTIVPGGASTYTVQGGNTVVSPTLSTSYTVSGTAVNGCTSAIAATVSVAVNPLPTVSVNSGTVCSGNSFTLVPGGATSYTIEGGATVVTPSANSTYTVIGISIAGCISENTATANITVNPNPTVSAISSETNVLCVEQSATLTASGALTYLWNSSATTAVIVVSPTTTTTYSVIGTGAGGCFGTATVTQSVSVCTGLLDVSEGVAFINVYPNPANDKIKIELNRKSVHTSVVVVNSLGQTIYSNVGPELAFEVNLTELPAGIYIIRVLENNKRMISKKLIKF